MNEFSNAKEFAASDKLLVEWAACEKNPTPDCCAEHQSISQCASRYPPGPTPLHYASILLAMLLLVVACAAAWQAIRKGLFIRVRNKLPETAKMFLCGTLVWSMLLISYYYLTNERPWGYEIADWMLAIVFPPISVLLAYLWWSRFVKRS